MTPLMQMGSQENVQNGLKALNIKEEAEGNFSKNFSLLLNRLKSSSKDTPHASPIQLKKESNSKEDGEKLSLDKAKGLLERLLMEGEDIEELPLFKSSAPLQAQNNEEKLLHPIFEMLSQNGSKESIKILLSEAKTTLKQQILLLDPSRPKKSLPNTLSSLLKLAKEIGVEIKELTLKDIPQTKIKQEFAHLFTTAIKGERKGAKLSMLIHKATKTEMDKIKEEKSQKEASPLKELLSDKGGTKKEILSFKASSKSIDEATIDKSLPKSELAKKAQPSRTQNVPATKVETIQSATPLAVALKSNKPITQQQNIEVDLVSATDETGVVEESHASINKEGELKSKIIEAKTMVKNLASDLHRALDEYKPPFTKLSLKLRPHKFGDVEVTLIQRGGNVHINISSNSTALATLMQNSVELRTQLAQIGLGDATMNFNHGNSKDEDKHNKKEQQKNRQERNELVKNDNLDELETTSLEIIIPQYI